MHDKNEFKQIVGVKIENWTEGQPPSPSNLQGRHHASNHRNRSLNGEMYGAVPRGFRNDVR